ncbi:metalloendoproteinase 1-like [Momordica charantia]|uniref:Metalloendoproteinase 1-like n=1 Tax=Momordica charantia TaxID=3673 RepID=A0A6J1BZK9_MOMCH|nr:metalloendoproteinase 1-like [Momordica charantia]
MAFKCLKLFLLLLASVAPRVILSHDHHIQFPEHLQGCRKGDNVEGIQNVKMHLQRYGYMRKDNNNTVNKESTNAFDEALESAIKKYQKNFNLNLSGALDRETLDLMSRPRCGVPDIVASSNNETMMWNSSHYAFFPGNLKWPNTKYHLTYTFINNYPSNYVAAVARALATWAGASQFTFAEAFEGETADIKISFERGNHGDGNPFDGRGGVLAHAFAPSDGRLHLDADESWTEGVVFNEFDVETVALHELGHILGLGHSKIEAAIMWPFLDPGATKGLNADDIDGIHALYA